MKTWVLVLGLGVIGSASLGGWAYHDHCEARRVAVRAELDALTLAPYGPQRVVYHVTDDGGVFDRRNLSRLGTLANHVKAVGEGRLDAHVILQGDGIYILARASHDPDLRQRVDALRRKGVRFFVCRNSLIDRGVSPKELHGVRPEDIVAAAVAEISSLEAAGYVYLRL